MVIFTQLVRQAVRPDGGNVMRGYKIDRTYNGMRIQATACILFLLWFLFAGTIPQIIWLLFTGTHYIHIHMISCYTRQ